MESESLRQIVAEHTERAAAEAQRYPYERAAVSEVEVGLTGATPVRQAVVLDAPRRTGKSVVLRQLLSKLRAIDPARAHYCDFTDIRLRGVGIQELVRALVPADWDPLQPMLLLLDEVHYTGDEWARELKFAVDHFAARIAVADSAVAVVRARLREELVGRVVHVRMYPLSFPEWRALRTTVGLPVASDRDATAMLQECGDYLQLGGFPDHVARRGELRLVHEMLRNIVIAQAVRDDIGRLRGLRDVDSLERLFVSRLANSGAQLSIRDDAQLARVSEPTVRHWIQALLDTGLLWSLDARVKSAGQYERGQPKLYAVDPSLIGACALPVFGAIDPQLLGRQVETSVAQALRLFCERTGARLSLYQSKTGAGHKEGVVDFVVEHAHGTYAIEVTARDDRHKTPGLARMSADLDARFSGVVSMRTRADTVDADGRSIHFIPLHEFLLRLPEATPEAWPW